MRIFQKGSKVNFVDEMDVVVGYDCIQASCGEDPDWFLHGHVADTEGDKTLDVEGYNFDAGFFVERTWRALDEGEAVTFRLAKPEAKDVFLTIYNAHNGYYAHDFTVSVGDKQTREGCL